MRFFYYLFEIKSIQAFITRTGKLKDLTNLSDNLDSLMDDDGEDSILRVVLKKIDPNGIINFIRRKGGAIHAYSEDREQLVKFRGVWTLLVRQIFPYLQFNDYLSKSGEDMDEAFICLNASSNSPVLTLPLATAIIQANSRTGLPDVFVDSKIKEIADIRDDADLTTLRTCRTLKTIRRDLYQKFFNEADPDGRLSSNFKEVFDKFQGKLNGHKDKDADHDIAFIHFDGNSIGKTAITLRSQIKNLDVVDQAQILNEFSKTVSESTKKAVSETLIEIYESISKDDRSNKVPFVFRPLVLGGDDITLLIDPKFALEFAEKFCNKFEFHSSKFIKDTKFFKEYVKDVKKLTASGGILFNKVNHPAANTHAIVEGLAEMAKKLTKQDDKKRAAVAFYRMSSSSTESFEEIMQKGRVFNSSIGDISVGSCAYFISERSDDVPTVSEFLKLIKMSVANKNSGSAFMQKFRAMLTEISKGDIDEARRIYSFMMEKEHISKEIKKAICEFFHHTQKHNDPEFGYRKDDWFSKKNNRIETPIADLLVLNHYANEKAIVEELKSQSEQNTNGEN